MNLYATHQGERRNGDDDAPFSKSVAIRPMGLNVNMRDKQTLLTVVFIVAVLQVSATNAPKRSGDLSNLKQNQQVVDFRVANLYSDLDGKIVGAKIEMVLIEWPDGCAQWS